MSYNHFAIGERYMKFQRAFFNDVEQFPLHPTLHGRAQETMPERDTVCSLYKRQADHASDQTLLIVDCLE